MRKDIEKAIHSMDPFDLYALGVKSGKLKVIKQIIEVMKRFHKKSDKYSQETLGLSDMILTELNKIKIDE